MPLADAARRLDVGCGKRPVALPPALGASPRLSGQTLGRRNPGRMVGSKVVKIATLAALVESYRDYLFLHESRNPKQRALKRFDDRLRSCPEAARSEAVVFEYLRARSLAPRILEDVSAGGLDFECNSEGDQFGVEVTAITIETLEKSGHRQAILGLLSKRLSAKSTKRQRHTYTGPGVLIVTVHSAPDLLREAAEQFLTGEVKIIAHISKDGPVGDSYLGTELKGAAYLQPKSDGVRLFRGAYALVLLMSIGREGCHVVGFEHPEPEHAMSISHFPHVPFGRVRWPLPDGKRINVEWVISYPEPDRHNYQIIEVTDGELKKGI